MPNPFDPVRFADNPEPRAPCVLVVDTSPAMGPDGLSQAAALLASLVEQWAADPETAKSVELAVVTATPPRVASGFAMVDPFVAPTLQLGTAASLPAAVDLAIDLVLDRKRAVRAQGLLLYRPTLLILTPGATTTAWDATAERLRAGNADRAFHATALAPPGADVDLLEAVTGMPPMPTTGLRLRDLLPWVG
jgi:uncharacterized protein YegL